MRLVTRKLWRAFPELDRFDDEQCRRFVRVAASGIVARGARWVCVAVACIFGCALIPMLSTVEMVCAQRGWLKGRVLTGWLGRPAWMDDLVYVAIGLVVMFSIGALFGAVTRDILLRLRLRKVLRTRGRCAGCTYFLGGLPVSPEMRVVCPECGFSTEVDRSLGELSGGEAGAARFAPSDAVIRASNPWLTAQRLWKWTKRGALGLAAVLLLAGVGWGWHEWRILKQAARAVAMKPGAAALMELAVQAQAPAQVPSPDAANAFDLLAALVSKMARLQAETIPEEASFLQNGMYFYPGGEWVAQRPNPGEDERAAKERALNEPPSMKLIEEFERQGVFSDMRAMVDAPVAVMAIPQPQNQHLLNVMLGDYSKLRQFARWNGGRMRLAVREDDPARFAETLDITLGLVRMLEKQPVLIGRLVASAIEALAYGELRTALRERNDARWLDACERVLKKYDRHASRSLPFEGERLIGKDLVCWVFSDPSHARLGKYSPALQQALVGWLAPARAAGRLGGLDENLAAIDAFYDRLIDASALPKPQRVPLVPLASDLVLVNLLIPARERSLRSMDQIEIDRVAIPLLIALERFRLETGGYPATLAELAPRWAGAGVLPVDPWSGKPFCYKRLDPTKDEQGRGFLLYAVGEDGVDNGGIGGVNPWEALTATGVDFIINDVKR